VFRAQNAILVALSRLVADSFRFLRAGLRHIGFGIRFGGGRHMMQLQHGELGECDGQHGG
jgi:hypothetical protein